VGVNGVMMQYFEWYIKPDSNHWKRLKEDAGHLKELGITSVWIPPCYKGTGIDDPGYGVYDMYDLGEFDQKGDIPTKYGTKEELLEAINELHNQGIRVYADVVLNHKAGADETQRFMAVEVDPENRRENISKPYEIEGWTKFNYEARQGEYSDFKWSWEHFNGTDYNNENGKNAIYLIQGEGKDWAEGVDKEFGNYDYLMFSNIDYKHPDVQKETKNWISWFIKETNIDGIRLDAIKHINDWFIKELLEHITAEFGEDFYKVGEYWEGRKDIIDKYLEEVDYKLDLFDVPLHYKLFEASKSGKDFDMRKIFDDTLVKDHPALAVTFVDNHDSQIGQSLESFIEPWFKSIAYSLILLRKDGYPCVFYGDYYGSDSEHPIDSIKEALDKLIALRINHSYGDQDDYFDHENVIGWVRKGNEEHPKGLAVIISTGDEAEKTMNVGDMHQGEIWIDAFGGIEDEIEIDEQGNGVFKVGAGSVSVYVKK